MATVMAALPMLLDGFIAAPEEGVGPLFDWYGSGDVDVCGPSTSAQTIEGEVEWNA